MSAPRYGSWNPTGRPEVVSTVTPLDTRGPARLWNAPAGYVVRERGDVDGLVTLEYLCPVHGRFEARVSRRESPDAMPCPAICERTWDSPVDGGFVRFIGDAACELSSPWSPSKFAAWQSPGEVKS